MRPPWDWVVFFGAIALVIVVMRGRIRRAFAARAARGAAAKTWKLPIRDVGTPASRFVDLRAIPADVLTTRAFTEQVAAALQPLDAAASVTWIVGGAAASAIDALSATAHVLVWARYVALARGAVHVLYVDGGVLGGAAASAISATGMTIATAWPDVVVSEAGGARTIHSAELFS